MILVEGGKFYMGSEYGENNEKPVHEVELDSFYIGKFPVTQRLWTAVMENNPSYYNGCDDCPVESVSWYDAVRFCNKLSEMTGRKPYYIINGKQVSIDTTANGFRLPTEAQWEYAARGGRKSRGYKYSGSDNIDEVAWYYDNSDYKTHPVGQKKPNELGLYDMSGNVWEWCWDWYDWNYYSHSPGKNPMGPDAGSGRVLRGGSWGNFAASARVAYRGHDDPGGSWSDGGLRLALPF